MHLASRGFDLRKLVGRESYFRTHAAVIDAIALGRADIGAVHCLKKTGSSRLDRFAWSGHPHEAKIRLFDVTPSIPNDALVGAAALDSRARTKLLGFALAPPAAAASVCRELLDADTFRVGTSAHYDALRQMMRKANLTL
jgi:ABC-type phosphate/phosphonate transport system substrate-binding protein